MIRFAEVFPEKEIVHALSGQLSWTHFREIIYLEDNLKRDFYAEMCRIERWSTRTLHARIQGMLYERTALTKKSEKLIKQELAALRDEDRMTPDLVFRDPYFLDLLFYHRSMRRLVAIELKLGKFQAQDKGQMELYLRWLEKYEKRDGEESPLLEAKLHEAIRLAREQIAVREVSGLERKL